jgi:hypothetical protein
VDRDVAGAVRELGNVGAAFGLGEDDSVDVGDAQHIEVEAMLVDAERVYPDPP